jgi:hypothetical protein
MPDRFGWLALTSAKIRQLGIMLLIVLRLIPYAAHPAHNGSADGCRGAGSH